MLAKEHIRFSKAIATTIALRLKLSPPLTLPHDILTVAFYGLFSIFLLYIGLMTILSGVEDHLFDRSPLTAGIFIGQLFAVAITLLGLYALIYCCRRLYITVVCRQHFEYVVRHGILIQGEVTSKEVVQGRWRVQYSIDKRQDHRWFAVTSNNELSVGDKANVIYLNDLLNFIVN
jgi:hypothetical protein